AEQLLERSLIASDEPAENLGIWLARHVVYLALLSGTWKGSGMIAILVTGGTFDKQYNELAGTLTFRETHVPEMLRLGRCRVDVAVRQLMMIDSLEMADADRRAIADACRAAAESRIVITHGTDTMVETARTLAAGNLSKTIVLTGAMV